MENLTLALKELGEKVGFEIALDGNGTCTLEMTDGRPIILQHRANLNELDFVAALGEVPAEVRADVFTDLLAANFYWNETLGATLSWNAAIQQVVLIYPLPLADATPALLETIFSKFLELQAAWKDRLADLVADGSKAEAQKQAAAADDVAAGGDDLIINP